MNELMMCPLPFMVSVKDSWTEEDDEVCTVYAIREYRGISYLL